MKISVDRTAEMNFSCFSSVVWKLNRQVKSFGERKSLGAEFNEKRWILKLVDRHFVINQTDGRKFDQKTSTFETSSHDGNLRFSCGQKNLFILNETDSKISSGRFDLKKFIVKKNDFSSSKSCFVNFCRDKDLLICSLVRRGNVFCFVYRWRRREENDVTENVIKTKFSSNWQREKFNSALWFLFSRISIVEKRQSEENRFSPPNELENFSNSALEISFSLLFSFARSRIDVEQNKFLFSPWKTVKSVWFHLARCLWPNNSFYCSSVFRKLVFSSFQTFLNIYSAKKTEFVCSHQGMNSFSG